MVTSGWEHNIKQERIPISIKLIQYSVIPAMKGCWGTSSPEKTSEGSDI